MMNLWVLAFVARLLPALGVACGATPACVGPMSHETTAHRVRNAPGGGAEVAAQQAADQLLVRQIRKAIRDDPGLGSAARAVAVSSDHGVVRLVGRVRTDKDKSSIAFKAAQMARVGRVHDHVIVGNCVAEPAR